MADALALKREDEAIESCRAIRGGDCGEEERGEAESWYSYCGSAIPGACGKIRSMNDLFMAED